MHFIFIIVIQSSLLFEFSSQAAEHDYGFSWAIDTFFIVSNGWVQQTQINANYSHWLHPTSVGYHVMLLNVVNTIRNR